MAALPSHQEALSVYLSQGPRRSLRRCREHFLRSSKWQAPSVCTFKVWSTTHKWKRAAKEHDIQVGAHTSEKAIEREASERASVFEGIQDGLLAMLRLLHRSVDKVKLESVADIEVLSRIIVALSAHGLDIERGKLPDQALLEKIVQQMSVANGGASDAPPTNDEMQRFLDLAMVEPGKPLN
jgi:hypothetical protein